VAQETLAMIATTAPDNWTLGAGASKVAAVAGNDGDTTYINNAVNNTEQKFQVAAPVVVTANDLINFVRIESVGRSVSTLASFFTKLFYAAGTSTATTHVNVPVAFTTFTDDFALAPDGGAWTLTKLQSLFASVRQASNRDMRVTSFVVKVDYTPAITGTGAQSQSAAAEAGSSVVALASTGAEAQSAGAQASTGAVGIAGTGTEDATGAIEQGQAQVAVAGNGVQSTIASSFTSDGTISINGIGVQDTIVPQQQSISVVLIDGNGGQVTIEATQTGLALFIYYPAVWKYQSTVSILHTHSSPPASIISGVSHVVDLKTKEQHEVDIYHKRESTA
jgi:hypothetical protein